MTDSTNEKSSRQQDFDIGEIAELICLDYAEGERNPGALLTAVAQLVNLVAHTSAEVEPVRADFVSAVERYQSWETRTLDEAFNLRDARKGAKLEAKKFDQLHGYEIYCRVEKLLAAGELKTAKQRDVDSVFDAVAADYSYGSSVIRDTYYRVKEAIGLSDKAK